MENAETTEEGAARETMEEANAIVDIKQLYTVYSLPHINQVYMMFMGDLINDDFGPGMESLEVALFNEEDIPWDQLAFKTIEGTLKNYFSDRQKGQFNLHTGKLTSQHGRKVNK
jgi:ADP-ribose pyrophosphatase YjhB (NUDIX family)